MVWDDPKKDRMTDYDWRVCGHDVSIGKLPTRRLDVPIPASKDGLHRLAHYFAGLSEDLHTLARTPGPVRSPIHDAMGLLDYKRQQFLQLRKDWELELKELESGSQPDQGISKKTDKLKVIG